MMMTGIGHGKMMKTDDDEVDRLRLQVENEKFFGGARFGWGFDRRPKTSAGPFPSFIFHFRPAVPTICCRRADLFCSPLLRRLAAFRPGINGWTWPSGRPIICSGCGPRRVRGQRAREVCRKYTEIHTQNPSGPSLFPHRWIGALFGANSWIGRWWRCPTAHKSLELALGQCDGGGNQCFTFSFE